MPREPNPRSENTGDLKRGEKKKPLRDPRRSAPPGDSIRHLTAKDRSEWARVFAQLTPRLVAAVMRSTPCSRAWAEDAVQHAWTVLWKRIEKMDDSRPAFPYLFVIARNYVHRQHRRPKKGNVLPFLVSHSHEDFTDRVDDKVLLMKALQHLPELERDALWLMKGCGKTARETGIALSALAGKEISDRAAEGYARRGLDRIKRYFKGLET